MTDRINMKTIFMN